MARQLASIAQDGGFHIIISNLKQKGPLSSRPTFARLALLFSARGDAGPSQTTAE